MGFADIKEYRQVERALKSLNWHIDNLFDLAPVMMHSIDSDGTLIRVNQRWLERLGYSKNEVLGRKSTEFLTEESRAWATRDTVPLFWRVGSARAIGYQFVGKDGGILDLLLDAEAFQDPEGRYFTYATLRDSADLSQWAVASATLRTLRQLTRLQGNLRKATVDWQEGVPETTTSELPAWLPDTSEGRWTKRTLEDLVELTRDIGTGLRGLSRTQEEVFGTAAEQQQEFLVIARSVDRTLADLSVSAAAFRPSE